MLLPWVCEVLEDFASSCVTLLTSSFVACFDENEATCGCWNTRISRAVEVCPAVMVLWKRLATALRHTIVLRESMLAASLEERYTVLRSQRQTTPMSPRRNRAHQ